MADPSALRPGEADVPRLAGDVLAAHSERRKRSRAPVADAAYAAFASRASEPERKRRPPTAPAAVNLAAAKAAAAALVRESPTYRRLNEAEERIDLAIMRKQQDIKDALKARAHTRTRTFRLYVFNTFRSQPDAADDRSGSDAGADPASPAAAESGSDRDDAAAPQSPRTTGVTPLDVPSWSLRIQGHFLTDAPPEPAPPTDQAPADRMPTDSDVRPAPAADVIAPSAPFTVAGVPAAAAPGGASSASAVPGPASTPTIASASAAASASTPAPAPMTAPAPLPAPASAPAATSPAVPAAAPTAAQPATPALLKCSDVFKKVILELDKEVVSHNNLIEWNRVDGEPASDGFEISRAGDVECKVRIFLYVDHKPERFKVTFALGKLIGVKTDSRSGIFLAVWEYIKNARLQCADDRTSVRVDDGLRSLMLASHPLHPTIKLQQLFEVIKTHMLPPGPIQIEYAIKLSGNVVDNQACYDIQVEVPDESLQESARQAGTFGLTYPNSADFLALNDKHLEALEQVAHHKRRREFLESFCANPVEFINHLILSQTRDLKVIAGSAGRIPEEERRSSFYQQQWVHEAVPRYLLRKAIADAAKKAADDTGVTR